MEDCKRLEAVRWILDEWSTSEETLPDKIYTPNPESYYHIAILRETTKLADYILSVNEKASNSFENIFKTKPQVDGRAVDISMPIQLSSGIVQTAALIEEAEEYLEDYRIQVEKYQEKASFGSDSLYEEVARKRLALIDKVFRRTRLFLHSHLWLHWITESVDQAEQVRVLMTDHDRFENAGAGAYAFFAFPPLIVATMSCTAVIEEVGAEYINQLTDGSIDYDDTNCSYVLDLLEEHTGKGDKFNLESIDETVVGARNDISHYMVDRRNVVDIDSFDQYVSAIAESIWLLRELNMELIFEIVDRFPGRIPRGGEPG